MFQFSPWPPNSTSDVYEINYGIKTGFNQAFIIDNRTKDALVAEDPKSAEIIKPVLRGRDIRRYQAQWARLWLIDCHNGYGDVPAIDIHDYPAVKDHLDGYYTQLEKRYDKGRTPYNLRNCAYHEDFDKEKLFWMDLTERGRFSYDSGGMFCVNTVYMLLGPAIKYLCAILNSNLISWYMNNMALNSGMGVTRWIKHTVENIPVPRISTTQQQVFHKLTDDILKAKANNRASDVSAAENAIGRGVYKLYGLTAAENSAIERELSLTNDASNRLPQKDVVPKDIKNAS